MTDVTVLTIDQLPTASHVATSDLIPLLQGGVTKAANFGILSQSSNLLPMGSYVAGTDIISVVQGDNVARQVTVNALGSSIITTLPLVIQSGTGAVATTAQAKLRERVSVFDFLSAAQIADVQSSTPTLDLTTPLAAFQTYIAANNTRYKGIFPSGIYRYVTSPNWASQDAVYETEGEVRFRYAGTGNAVTIDGGAAGVGLYNFRMGRVIVEAPSSAQNGVYGRAMHHSRLSFNVRGAGTTYAGIRLEWCVCTVLEQPTVSVNENGWYTSAKPQDGIYLTRRSGTDYTTYCDVISPVVEGTTNGAVLDYSTGNKLIGGTLEGCTSMGLNMTANGSDNKIEGIDFESNTTRDIYDQGTANQIISCDTTKLVTIESTAVGGTLFGGRHSQISVVAGAINYTINNAKYNRLNDGSTLSDSGTSTRKVNNLNMGTAAFDDTPVVVLAKSGAAVSCPADVTEDTLATITVPARAMGANGVLRVHVLFSHTNSVNNKTLSVRYSGASGTQAMVVVSSAWVSSEGLVTIRNRNATNSQVLSAMGANSNGTTLATQRQTSAVDTTAATTIVITGQKASAGETLTLESYCVELMPS